MYYITQTEKTNEYLNVSKQVRMDFLLQHKFGTKSNLNLLSKDMIIYLLKTTNDALFHHYKMMKCNIGENQFLIDSSLKEMIPDTSKYKNAELKITDLINETTLPKIKDKSNEELSLTFQKLLEFCEQNYAERNEQEDYNFSLNEDSNTRILNEWETQFIASLDNDINQNLTVLSTHLWLPPLTELCVRRMIDLYKNVINRYK